MTTGVLDLTVMNGGGGGGITVVDVFRDFRGRRAGIIKALTSDVEEFLGQCHPDKESLCLYGFPCGQWGVTHLPAEEFPPQFPHPALGINFARDAMQKKEEWLSLIAIHSDSWLLSLAFYFGARFGFGETDRKKLFNMINDLPTIFEVRMAGASKKQTKVEKKSASKHSGNESASSYSSNNL